MSLLLQLLLALVTLVFILTDIFILIQVFYQIFFILIGRFIRFKPFRQTKQYLANDNKWNFGLIICAHNEEKVIANTMEEMAKLNYPREYLKIIVICDNCTDNTYDIAKFIAADYGDLFTIIPRQNSELRGKPHAVDFAFQYIKIVHPDINAISIADADNIYDSNFFRVMNDYLNSGSEIIQGYLGVKNPNDNLLTQSNYICYNTGAKSYFQTRKYLGMSTMLGGTGFVLTKKAIEQIGWNMTSLTEDLEFSVKALLKGYRIDFAHDAITYDEKPTTLAASHKQRQRWQQGFFDVSGRYTWSLIKQLFGFEKPKVSKKEILDYLLIMLTPYRMMLFAFFIFSSIIFSFLHIALNPLYILIPHLFQTLFIFFMACNLVYFWSIISLNDDLKNKYSSTIYLITIYSMGWYFVNFKAFFKRKSKVWVKTDHKITSNTLSTKIS